MWLGSSSQALAYAALFTIFAKDEDFQSARGRSRDFFC
jgi:hypothetical protein